MDRPSRTRPVEPLLMPRTAVKVLGLPNFCLLGAARDEQTLMDVVDNVTRQLTVGPTPYSVRVPEPSSPAAR